jgi:hypothetical protein
MRVGTALGVINHTKCGYSKFPRRMMAWTGTHDQNKVRVALPASPSRLEPFQARGHKNGFRDGWPFPSPIQLSA